MARLDQLEERLEILIEKVIDEVNNGNKPKDLPLNEFFSTFCTLKAWDERHSSAIVYKGSLGLFFKFMRKKYPKVKSLRETDANNGFGIREVSQGQAYIVQEERSMGRLKRTHHKRADKEAEARVRNS